MKALTILIFSWLIISSYASSDELPPISQIKPSVAEEGSLANEKLIDDTVAELSRVAGISSDAKILKFVIQQPVGRADSRAWREMWIANPGDSAKRFIITFREDGPDAAKFEIQEM
ncbi:hypothetical protein [Microbulbifer sp. JMSA003]|uniref:hypothetical protein n=1 Tax=unclassified Microbulbifer TaxID=2619833 RepID=UPI0040393CF2